MKRIIIVMMLVTVAWSGSVFALPWDGLNANWVVSGSMDYWTITDLTTGADGDNLFQIQLEQAAYESAFGLYNVDDDGGLVSKFEVFAPSDSPLEMQNVNFWNDSGSWKVTKSYIEDDDLNNDGWVDFSNVFGFYYDVDTEPNTGTDYTFFTDNGLNTAEAGEEHIMTAYNSDNKWVLIYLDDQIGNGDGDFTDMTVFVNDVAPVPEPGTLLLLGSGLIGLAYLKRRKA